VGQISKENAVHITPVGPHGRRDVFRSTAEEADGSIREINHGIVDISITEHFVYVKRTREETNLIEKFD